MAVHRLLIALAIALAGCGRASVQPLGDAGGPADAALPADGSVAAFDAGEADAGQLDGGAADAGALFPVRTALHLHSAISHDACDGHSSHPGPLIDRDLACVRQLKQGLCSARIEVALLTDHPAYMDTLGFADDLLYQPDAGDQ